MSTKETLGLWGTPFGDGFADIHIYEDVVDEYVHIEVGRPGYEHDRRLFDRNRWPRLYRLVLWTCKRLGGYS